MKYVALFLMLAFPSVLNAQTVSLEELTAKIDKKVGDIDGFRALLDDPDPGRSLSALIVMLESGDPVLVRMALETGVTNPNPSVRQAALEGYFASGPNLDVRLDFSSIDDEQVENAQSLVTSYLGGSLGADKVGSASYKVGEFDKENGCYKLGGARDMCLARLSGPTVSLLLNDQWVALDLSESGEFLGKATFSFNTSLPATVTMRIVQ